MLTARIGTFCIVRSHIAGCFVGTVKSISKPNGDGSINVELVYSRQLRRPHGEWSGGIGLADTAEKALTYRANHLDVNSLRARPIEICGVCQIEECSSEAREDILKQPNYWDK